MRFKGKAVVSLTLVLATLATAGGVLAGDERWSWRRIAERLEELLRLAIPKGGTAYSGFPIAVPGTIELEKFNNGGEGVAYHDDTTANLGGLFRPSERVDIYSCTDVDCTPYHVGEIKSGEWMDYAITTSQPGVYSVETTLARTVSGTATYHLKLDAINVTGPLAVPLTGGNTTFSTVTHQPIYVSNGAHNLQLADDQGTWRADRVRFIRLTQQSHQTTPWPVGVVEAERYDTGGAETAYHDIFAGNSPGGAYRTDDVDIQAVAGAGNGHVVTAMHGGEWLEYTVQIPTTGLYSFNFRHKSPPTAVRVEVNGVDATGTVSLPSTGAVYQTTTKTSVALSAGAAVVRIHVVAGSVSLNLDWFEFIKQNDPPTVALTSPAIESLFDTNNIIRFAATASDPDGSISKVEFYAGAQKVGEDLTSPYEYLWDPSTAGSYSLTAVATDNVLATTTSAPRAITITVPSAPFGGIPRTIPGLVEAEDYDTGGLEIGYHEILSGPLGNDYRNDNPPHYVDVMSCDAQTEVACGYKVFDVKDYEWLRYTVDVRKPGVYSAQVRVANLATVSGATFRLEVDGIDVTGNVTIPLNGTGQFFTLTTPSFTLTPGVHVIRFVPLATNIELNWIEFVGVAGGYRGVEPTFPSDAPRIEAEHFDSGGEGYGYHDLTATNDGGSYRPGGVDIASASTHSNGHRVEAIQPAEWLRYSINVSTATSYRIFLHAGSGVAGTTVRVTANGADIGTFAVPNTGGTGTMQKVSQLMGLPAGPVDLRLVGATGVAGVDWLEIQPSAQAPYGGGAPATIPGRIRAEHYDRGGEGVAYQDSDGVNVDGGGTRRDGVDLVNCAEYECGAAVTGIAPDEWLEYSVDVAATGDYEMRVRVSANPAQGLGRTFEILMDGTTVNDPSRTGIETLYADSSGLDQWRTERLSPIALTAGSHVVRFRAISGLHRLHWIEFVPVAEATGALTATITSPPTGMSKDPLATFDLVGKAQDPDLADGIDHQVSIVEYYIGAGTTSVCGLEIAGGSPPPVEHACQTDPLPLGTYTAVMVVTDENGVRTQSDGVALTVQNGPPTLTLARRDPIDNIDPGVFAWRLTRNDPGNQIARVLVLRKQWQPARIYLAADLAAPFTWPIDGGNADLTFGTHRYCAFGLNSAGQIISYSNCELVEITPNYRIEMLSVTPTSVPVAGSVTMRAKVVYLLDPPDEDAEYVDDIHFKVHQNPQAFGEDAGHATVDRVTNEATVTWAVPIWTQLGTHYARALGVRNENASPLSTPENAIPFTVTGPEVQLSADPRFGLMPGATTTLTAGLFGLSSIDRVEFRYGMSPGFSGGTLIATDSTSPTYTTPWTNPGAGTYYLWATAYPVSGQPINSNQIVISVGGSGDVDGNAPVSLDSELGTHDPTVGAIGGTPGVSGGAATYDIPIVVPPGRRGMEPKLALSYNSRNGNGIAGMGWSLSGLSSIHRCPRTLAQDEEVRAVEFTNDDRLCLDGQRLMSTDATYGQVGDTYRTEIDTFVKVTQLGGDLIAGGSYFKVQTKGGDTLWYGAALDRPTTGGRVVPETSPGVPNASAPLSWLLVLREDPVGNGVRYDYATFASGENLISQIEYTLHNGADVNPSRIVSFDYTEPQGEPPRGDQNSAYIARRLVAQTKRLWTVTTIVGSEVVRQYSLDFHESGSTRRTLLESVQECATRDAGGWDCLPLTQIEWQEGSARYKLKKFDFSQAVAAALLAMPPAPDLFPGPYPAPDPSDGGLGTEPERPSLVSKRTADFDGDGFEEFIFQRKPVAPDPAVTALVTLGADRAVRRVITIASSELQASLLGYTTEHRPDFNRDNRVDLAGKVDNTLKVYYWNGTSSCQPGVVNDLENCFVQQQVNGPINLADVAGVQTDIKHIGDLDSDGLADVVTLRACTSTSCWRQLEIYMNVTAAGGPLTFVHATTIPLASGPDRRQDLLQTLDFDGDGLVDFILSQDYPVGGESIPTHIRLGRRAAQPTWDTSVSYVDRFGGDTPPDQAHALSFWTDLNADGLQDLLFPETNSSSQRRWHVRLNTGGWFGPRIEVAGTVPHSSNHPGLESCATSHGGCYDTVPYRYSAMMKLWDYDGDGRQELLVPHRFAARVCTFHRPFLNEDCPIPPSGGEGGDHPILVADRGIQDCHDYYYCPEPPPSSGQAEALHSQMVIAFDTNDDGKITGTEVPVCPQGQFCGGDGAYRMYASHAGKIDQSSYWMSATRFRQVGPLQFEIQFVPESGIVASRFPFEAQDLFGDGLVDAVGAIGCPYSSDTECGIPYFSGAGVRYSATDVPEMLAGDPAFGPLLHGAFFNENLGPLVAGGDPGRGVPETPDLVKRVVASATDEAAPGLDIKAEWSYYPLSSDAGRTVAGLLPFYSPVAPSDGTTGADNTDGESVTFTSSMPIVASFRVSNGVGGVNERRYGYRKAVYNNLGRGFLGFREIFEEDVAGGLRTRTIFRHRFPVVGGIERIEITSTNDPADTQERIREEDNVYRCVETLVDDANVACPSAEAANERVWYPFVAERHTKSYAAETAEAGTYNPTPISRSDSYVFVDLYGNPTDESTLVEDVDGSGGDGFARLAATVTGTHREYLQSAGDVDNWWVDRLYWEQTAAQTTYFSAHGLPTGSAPLRRVRTEYLFNADRTLAQKSRFNGDPALGPPNPSLVDKTQFVQTRYLYSQPLAYGQPSHEIVAAYDNLEQPSVLRDRTTTYGYSDGAYYLALMQNPLQHTETSFPRDRDGSPRKQIAINGQVTVTEYDAFGRQVRECYPDSQNQDAQSCAAFDTTQGVPGQRMPATKVAWAWCGAAGCGSDVPTAEYKVTHVQNGSPTATQYFDQLGRPVGQSSRNLGEGIVITTTTYDERGLVASTSVPHGEGQPSFANQFGPYDVLGRPKEKIVPSGVDDCGNVRVTYEYFGRAVRIGLAPTIPLPPPACPESRTMWRVADSVGRTLKTIDADGFDTKFWFDGSGNALVIEDVEHHLTQATYNDVGQRQSVDDPNMGQSTFLYDGLGEVLRQTDARNISTVVKYDVLGRRISRTVGTVTTPGSEDYVWTYDPPEALGALDTALRRYVSEGNQVERLEDYEYEARRSVVTGSTVTQRGVPAPMATSYAYDAYYGRPMTTTYPSGDVVTAKYDKYGIPTGEVMDGVRLRHVLGLSPRGQPLVENMGGVAVVERDYYPATGAMEFVRNAMDGELRTIDYTYDVFGNLAEQTLNGTVAETYTYDRLSRLSTAMRTGVPGGAPAVPLSYSYSPSGNFTQKSDFGSGYTYGGGNEPGNPNDAGPNAVKQVTLNGVQTPRAYFYDDSGNMVSHTGTGSASLLATYDHDNLPTRLERNGAWSQFYYDAGGMRTRQILPGGARVYVGNYERLVLPGGDTVVHKVNLGGYAVITRGTSGLARVDYLLRDRLGSVDAIVDSNGDFVDDNIRGYDPFGKPRTSTWADAAPPELTDVSITPRGFTQHEHLNDQQLIHMNGRAYDYALGRFLTVDPIIQFPTNSQSLNPYSYIMNNPLAGSDPSGYASDCGSGSQVSCDRWRMASGASSLSVRDGRRANLQRIRDQARTLAARASVGAITTGITACSIHNMYNCVRMYLFAEGIPDPKPLPPITVIGSRIDPVDLANWDLQEKNRQTLLALERQERERLFRALRQRIAGQAWDFVAIVAAPAAAWQTTVDMVDAASSGDLASIATGVAAVGCGPVRGLCKKADEAALWLKKTFDLYRDAKGKIHGAPLPGIEDLRGANAGQLQEWVDELRGSITTRKQELKRLGDEPGHRNRIREEENLLRSVEKLLESTPRNN